MSNINNQTQDLFALGTMQDLDNESAAAVSGGLADVTLHSDSGQKGRTLETNKGIANLGKYGFNNITSSVAVTNNQVWRFYSDANFQGKYIDVGPDEARDLPREFNDRISSLKSIT
jgi:hypothetical protein